MLLTTTFLVAFSLILIASDLFLPVDSKGNKMRAKRPNDREKTRLGTKGSSSSSPSSPDDNLRKLTEYQFRNATHEERLLTYLFEDYEPVARAVMDTDKPVIVTIDFVLLRIHGLEERGQVLTTTGLVIAEWTDDRLTWPPEKFGNLTDIIVKSEKLWLPELAIMNGAEELVPDFERIRVLLGYDGRLHWEPGGIFRTTCDIDIAYFPFDTQHCPIVIGAYSYSSSRMNITNASNTVSTHDFQQNGEWHIFSTAAIWNITVLECCPGNGYSHVVFTLILKRRYKFYLMNIVLPCLMLSTLILAGFLLPPDAGEKISLGISVLLAFTVFLLMIADTIPRTSLAIPLIVVYLMATMILGAISVCMTVLVLNLHHQPNHRQMSPWLRRLLLVHVARLVRIDTASRRRLSLRSPSAASAVVVNSTDRHQIWKRRTDYVVPLTSVKTMELSNGFQQPQQQQHELKTISQLTIKRTSSSLMTSASTTSSKFDCLCLKRAWRRKPTSTEVSKKSAAAAKIVLCSSKTSTTKPGVDPATSADSVDALPSGNSCCITIEEWKEMAQVIDRLFFWIIFVLMTLSTVVILMYPSYSGDDSSFDGGLQ